MPNLIPQDIREWMRRMEFKVNDLTRRNSNLIPGDIGDGVSLDNYRSSGRYRRQSAVGTTTLLGYPFNGASGTLEVYWDPQFTQVQQIFYDRAGSIWNRWSPNGTTWNAWFAAGSGGAGSVATTVSDPLQTISSTTLAPLPTNVTATLQIPPGTSLVQASISCLMGSGVNFSPTSSASVRYWLSGALVYQPDQVTAGIGGVNQPIGVGGGTLSRVHEITVSSATNLTIQARGVLHQGTNTVGVRGIVLQLVVLRRV